MSVMIFIKDSHFIPDVTHIRKGLNNVTFSNRDAILQEIQCKGITDFRDVPLSPGESMTVSFPESGRFELSSRLNAHMKV